MTGQKDGQYHVMKGTAVLTACVVQTLNESDQSFQERFVNRLEHAYALLRDDPDSQGQELQMLSWTRELLTGFAHSKGKGDSVLDD